MQLRINFINESLFQIKKKIELPLYKVYTSGDRRAGNKKIKSNSISVTNKNSEYISFKNNLKNLPDIDIDSFDTKLSNIQINSNNTIKNKNY